MHTREIPREEWHDYLDEFSKQHIGRRVTIEVVSPDIGDQILAQELPLQGVSFDRPAEAEDAGESVSITAGDTAARHVTHTISNAASVRVAQSDDGADQGLQIESEDGPMTLVTFPVSRDSGMAER